MHYIISFLIVFTKYSLSIHFKWILSQSIRIRILWNVFEYEYEYICYFQLYLNMNTNTQKSNRYSNTFEYEYISTQLWSGPNFCCHMYLSNKHGRMADSWQVCSVLIHHDLQWFGSGWVFYGKLELSFTLNLLLSQLGNRELLMVCSLFIYCIMACMSCHLRNQAGDKWPSLWALTALDLSRRTAA